jgi:hypothetical protein
MKEPVGLCCKLYGVMEINLEGAVVLGVSVATLQVYSDVVLLVCCSTCLHDLLVGAT